MSIFYIPKSGKKKKRQNKCRVCKARIMWVVNPLGRNIPIEYDPQWEDLFDGIGKVYYVSGMIQHFPNCPAHKLYKR